LCAKAAAPKLRKQRRRAMHYVYILCSVGLVDRYYVGVTEDLKNRFAKHNAGDVPHTSKHRPWELKTYIAFSDEK
jgi:predicted GIY-YIG superfamily endonuclease